MAGQRKPRIVKHEDSPAQESISFLNLQGAGGWTLNQAFELVVRERLKPSTVESYQRSLANWKKYSGNPPLREINADVAQRFVDAMLKDFSPVTVNRVWNCAVSIMGRFFSKTNAHRKALGILPGRPPRPVIPQTRKDKADYLGFDPLSLTVYECWWRFVRPDITHPATLSDQECALRNWEELTGNPPIRDVTSLTMDRFKRALIAQGLAPETINKKLAYIGHVFMRLGPQEYRNPGGLGILFRRPYTRDVPVQTKLPRVLTTDQLCRIYGSCCIATWPQPERSGLSPEQFWQAAIVLGYNTGLGREELFGLRHDEVDFELGMITVIRRKTNKIQRLAINDAVRDVLRAIWRPERGEHLLYATSSNRQLYREWRKIQLAAGVICEDDDPFGFHDLRRTCVTELERICQGAGTHQAGHSSPQVTWKHYRNPSAATRDAVERLPQPWPRLIGDAAAGETEGGNP